MVMQMMRSGASGGFFKYFLFGLIGLSVGGLALMDVRGVLGGNNIGGSDVLRVGEETIDLRSFDRTIRRSLAQYRISPEKAYRLGLVDEILSGQVSALILAQEAHRKGFEMNKDQLALRVAEIVSPNIRPTQTMQQALEELLQRQGMSEPEFISILKREIAGEFMMKAVRSGYSFNNEALGGELFKFQNQTRDIQAIFFPDKEINDASPATDEQLEHIYESVKRMRYKIPEYRSIKMAIFEPEKLDIKVDVTPQELGKAYEDHKDRFTTGETITLTQALLDDASQANDIYDQIQSGKSFKEAVISATGSDKKYFEKRKFETFSLIPEMAKAISDLEEGGVAAPVKTMLGYHVLRLDSVTQPSILPFEKVKKEIKTALLQEKRDEQIYKIAQDFDKNLDMGISFEDMEKTKKFPVRVISIAPFDKEGQGKDDREVLKYLADEDKKSFIELSYELAGEGEVSLLQELPSGMLAALKLESKEDETYTPFQKIKKELANQFIADQKHAQNRGYVAKYLAEIGTGGIGFESISKEHNKGIMSYKAISLSGEMPDPLSPETRPAIFQTPVDGYEMLEMKDAFAIIKITGYDVPQLEQNDDAQKMMQEIANNIDKEMQDDSFLMYLRLIAQREKPTINERLLKQIYNKEQ